MGVWIGGVWNGHFPESGKYFSEAEISRKMPEFPRKERFSPNFRIPWTCYRGNLGPSGPKLERESENMSSRRLSAAGPKKSKNGVDKESKSTVFQLFLLFFDSVFDFLSETKKLPVPVLKGKNVAKI